MAVTILSRNYPESPLEGSQKKNFNRLFIANFLFLAVHFGIMFSEYRDLKTLDAYSNNALSLRFWLPFINYAIMLIFQFIILTGLYFLRVELYKNFMQKKFEFERD